MKTVLRTFAYINQGPKTRFTPRQIRRLRSKAQREASLPAPMEVDNVRAAAHFLLAEDVANAETMAELQRAVNAILAHVANEISAGLETAEGQLAMLNVVKEGQ